MEQLQDSNLKVGAHNLVSARFSGCEVGPRKHQVEAHGGRSSGAESTPKFRTARKWAQTLWWLISAKIQTLFHLPLKNGIGGGGNAGIRLSSDCGLSSDSGHAPVCLEDWLRLGSRRKVGEGGQLGPERSCHGRKI